MNKHFIFAYLLTAVFLFSIAGVIVYQQRQINSLISQSTTKKTTGILILPSTSPKVSPAPMLDPLSRWKAYKNEKLGFGFQYPDTWMLVTPPTNAILKLTSDINLVYFNIYLHKTDKSLNNFLLEKYPVSNLDELGLIKNQSQIDNQETIAIGPNGIGEHKTVFVKNNLSVYEISVNLDIKKMENGQYANPNTSSVDQILSTFKFTDSKTAQDITTWNIYKNIDYPFQISYPSGWKLRTTYGKSVNNTNNDRIAGIDISTDLTTGSRVLVNIIDSGNSTLTQWVSSSSGRSKVAAQPDQYFGPNPAYVFMDIDESTGKSNTDIYFKENGVIVMLSSNLHDLSSRVMADQILSTFKFTK